MDGKWRSADAAATVTRAIAADLAARPIGAAPLIHLGDYIDLGPGSAGVIELLAHAAPIPGVTTINLRGDHERMLLEALDGDRAAATDWLWSGARRAGKLGPRIGPAARGMGNRAARIACDIPAQPGVVASRGRLPVRARRNPPRRIRPGVSVPGWPSTTTAR
ncbi:MAG TPA: hypothetical protein VND19_22945 [Acetobacteraceae bacterium]|nr:hypothetical protein [Acetobacteraceae bacterium]